MTWVQAALGSWAEGTTSSVAHPRGGSAVSWSEELCEDQDCLCPGVVVVEPQGLCGHLSCLLGKLEYPRGLSSHGLRTVFDRIFLSSAILGLVMGA